MVPETLQIRRIRNLSLPKPENHRDWDQMRFIVYLAKSLAVETIDSVTGEVVLQPTFRILAFLYKFTTQMCHFDKYILIKWPASRDYYPILAGVRNVSYSPSTA